MSDSVSSGGLKGGGGGGFSICLSRGSQVTGVDHADSSELLLILVSLYVKMPCICPGRNPRAQPDQTAILHWFIQKGIGCPASFLPSPAPEKGIPR